MTPIKHPWQLGSTELISFALERMHKGTDFDRRLAFLILDVGVETLLKTFLTLPDSVTGAKSNFFDRNKAAQEGFHGLIQGIEKAIPEKSQRLDLTHVQYYHDMRNTLYHQGNTVSSVREEQLHGYANLAVELLYELLKVDLSDYLIPPESELPSSKDPAQDSVEVELSTGRYRLMRLQSKSIRILHLDTGNAVKPVLPFIKEIIQEKSLSIQLEFESGNPKNTQQLGREVINELKPTAWHGLVPGQKVRKDTLISMLSGRILDGYADKKNWEVVNTIRAQNHEFLVFQPTGKGIGNSPFNLYCWYTESGDRLK